jgi:hypothetical protein
VPPDGPMDLMDTSPVPPESLPPEQAGSMTTRERAKHERANRRDVMSGILMKSMREVTATRSRHCICGRERRR